MRLHELFVVAAGVGHWKEEEEEMQKSERRRVGVAIDEGMALPMVELAVLIAGGCIVPLDPRDPCARLASGLLDADLALVVAKDTETVALVEAAALAASASSQDGHQRLHVVLAADVVDVGPPASPQPVLGMPVPFRPLPPEMDDKSQFMDVSPSTTSHLFFTSGSTGRPKGCIVAHRALANYCAARNVVHGVVETSVCFVASAHTFDPSLGDIMATWAVGGCVALAPRIEIFERLGPLLAASGATHLCCTPSLFATLSGTWYEYPLALPRLRVVALGGEPTPPSILAAWAGRAEHRLLNTYGVTECCVYNAARDMHAGDPPGLVGSPLPGNLLATIRVAARADDDLGDDVSGDDLLPDLSAALPGDTGELLVAGAQVGEGYAKRPELTRQRFVSHSGLGRSYLTGDLVRDDKQNRGLALLGRRDTQVKVRGHRIELSEVEHWLLAAAGGALLTRVAAACLDGRLIAFCVPALGIPLPRASRALRAVLRWLSEGRANRCEGAPVVMRPQRYVFAEALPLTASGKVARGQLSELLRLHGEGAEEDEEEDEEGETGQTSRTLTSLEATVAEAWASELSQPPRSIGRRSDFRELGGHSIAALRVCRRLALRLSSGADRQEDAEMIREERQDKEDTLLGGDLGELAGPFSPTELLRRPCLAEYTAHLARHVGEAGVAAKEEDRVWRADDVEGPDDDVVSLLHRAASVGAVPLIEFLVTGCHAPVDGRCSMKRLKAATRAQRSLRRVGRDGLRPPGPLHSAASAGSVEALAALLRLRASVTATEAHGVMALHLAASVGPREAVTLLLQARAPLAAKDTNLQTALHFAARAGNLETSTLLLGQWLADDDLVRQGMRVYGGPLDWRDRWHRTPVHWAVLNNHAGVLKVLLEAKAEAVPPRVPVSKHSKNTTLRHESPLEIARRHRNVEISNLLVLHSAIDESPRALP